MFLNFQREAAIIHFSLLTSSESTEVKQKSSSKEEMNDGFGHGQLVVLLEMPGLT